MRNATQTVRDIVINDYRTADVFKKWGINYCCGGNIPLAEACAIKEVDIDTLELDLQQATQTLNLPNSVAFHKWPVEFLIDYIVYVHHDYVKAALPALKQLVQSFVNGHAEKYPYLLQVRETFLNLAIELEEHIQEEEESIFPYVKQISNTFKRKEVYGGLFVRTMRKPLAEVTAKEHSRIRALLNQLREQTANYTFGADACANHQVIYNKLKEFDAYLIQHKHLENNILFPKALEMEKTLLQL